MSDTVYAEFLTYRTDTDPPEFGISHFAVSGAGHDHDTDALRKHLIRRYEVADIMITLHRILDGKGFVINEYYSETPKSVSTST